MNTTVDQIHTAAGTAADKVGSSPAYQAYRILHFGLVVAPILAGLDKFFHLLVNWDQGRSWSSGENVACTPTHAHAHRGCDRNSGGNWRRD